MVLELKVQFFQSFTPETKNGGTDAYFQRRAIAKYVSGFGKWLTSVCCLTKYESYLIDLDHTVGIIVIAILYAVQQNTV